MLHGCGQANWTRGTGTWIERSRLVRILSISQFCSGLAGNVDAAWNVWRVESLIQLAANRRIVSGSGLEGFQRQLFASL